MDVCDQRATDLRPFMERYVDLLKMVKKRC